MTRWPKRSSSSHRSPDDTSWSGTTTSSSPTHSSSARPSQLPAPSCSCDDVATLIETSLTPMTPALLLAFTGANCATSIAWLRFGFLL
eukprot:7160346-Heterocapsa_arctica.AAC.1